MGKEIIISSKRTEFVDECLDGGGLVAATVSDDLSREESVVVIRHDLDSPALVRHSPDGMFSSHLSFFHIVNQVKV